MRLRDCMVGHERFCSVFFSVVAEVDDDPG